jgi:hypothetical protein
MRGEYQYCTFCVAVALLEHYIFVMKQVRVNSQISFDALLLPSGEVGLIAMISVLDSRTHHGARASQR